MKPEFFDNPVLARCSHGARLLFAACWQVADRLGVFEWEPAKLRKYAFGYDDITSADVAKMLDELLKNGFVKYTVFKEKSYGYVINLAKHQRFHVAEKSKFDEVAAGAIWLASRNEAVPAPQQHGASTVLAPTQHATDTVPEALRMENGEWRTECGEPAGEPAAPNTRPDPGKGKFMAKFVLAHFAQSAKKHSRPCPAAFDQRDEWAAADIYGKYSHADESRPDWQGVIDKYHADEFYERYGWSVQNLAKHLDQIANRKAAKGVTADDVPW